MKKPHKKGVKRALILPKQSEEGLKVLLPINRGFAFFKYECLIFFVIKYTWLDWVRFYLLCSRFVNICWSVFGSCILIFNSSHVKGVHKKLVCTPLQIVQFTSSYLAFYLRVINYNLIRQGSKTFVQTIFSNSSHAKQVMKPLVYIAREPFRSRKHVSRYIYVL